MKDLNDRYLQQAVHVCLAMVLSRFYHPFEKECSHIKCHGDPGKPRFVGPPRLIQKNNGGPAASRTCSELTEEVGIPRDIDGGYFGVSTPQVLHYIIIQAAMWTLKKPKCYNSVNELRFIRPCMNRLAVVHTAQPHDQDKGGQHKSNKFCSQEGLSICGKTHGQGS